MTIDMGLVALFLALTAYFAYKTRLPVATFQDFALGGRNFSTSFLINTLVATTLSGEVVQLHMEISYTYGFFWSFMMMTALSLGFVLVAVFIAPKARRVLGHLSVAESMGSFYGPSVRVITTVVALMVCLGGIAFQIKFTSDLFAEVLHLKNAVIVTVLLTGFIIAYSTLGGIQAVTLTDVVQCITFCLLLPFLVVCMFDSFCYKPNRLESIFEVPKYVSKGGSSWYVLSYIILGLMPELEPAGYQRLLMSRDEKQVKDLFLVAAVVFFLAQLFMVLIARFVWSYDPDLEASHLISYLIQGLSTGLKGIFMVCVLALIMSSADSYLNTSSILVVHDLFPSLLPLPARAWIKKHSLKVVRVTNVILGCIALVLALVTTRLLSLFEVSFLYYETLVAIPLLVFFLGFKPTPRAAFTAMIASFVFITSWIFYRPSLFPAGALMILAPAIAFCVLVMVAVHFYAPGPHLQSSLPPEEDF